jgi:hypothetical protein
MVRQFTVDEVLTTTRSVRKRLDFTRSIEYRLIEECLAAAQQAPTGGNLQTWGFVKSSHGNKTTGRKPCIPLPTSALPGLCELITKGGK